MKNFSPYFRLLYILVFASMLAACGGGSGNDPGPGGTDPGDGGDEPAALPVGSKGILFVAQTPNPSGTSDINTHMATFGNGLPSVQSAPRGGSLFLLQADGRLRDLLDEALKNGCTAGDQFVCDAAGATAVNANDLLINGYVVRRPIVHWDADRILFSMTSGVIHEQFKGPVPANPKWQLYEITGLDADDTPLLTKVADQPDYNNVDGVYGSNDEIFFISDMPVTGNPHHYPQRDEYESLPINSGLWKLDRETGAVTLMDHSPSGDFGPKVTPRGQLLFTRWDHLQQDQQASNSMHVALDDTFDDSFGIYTYASEDDVGPDQYVLMKDAVRARLEEYVASLDDGETALAEQHLRSAGDSNGTFPEPNKGNPFYNWGDKRDDAGNERTVAGEFQGREIPFRTPSTRHGKFNYLIFNHFLPWQIRQDGEQCETYRHTGLHENGGFVLRSYYEDDALRDVEETRVRIKEANGFFLNHVHEEADTGFEVVTGVVAPEFGTNKSGSILQFIDEDVIVAPQLHENGDAVSYRFLTDPEDQERIYRDPVLLSDGRLIAAVSRRPEGDQRHVNAFDFRLHELKRNENTGFYEPDRPVVAQGVERSFDFWMEEGGLRQFSGRLWEIEAQEVIAQPRPVVPPAPLLERSEQAVFDAVGVSPEAFRDYLRRNNLAAIVIRNATVRDEADTTQPFNLVVERNGVQRARTVRNGEFVEGETKLYPISYLQLMRGDYLRGYLKFADFDGEGNFIRDDGRRIQPNPLQMVDALANNLPVAGNAPAGAVPIFEDGSIAALVPARRALTWQTTDEDGSPIVLERYWLTFQPGEIRVCASCHGVNDRAQDGSAKPDNEPLALRALLEALGDEL